MTTGVALLVLYVGGALSISFLCSLLEAALLSVRLVTLIERKEAGDRGAALLLALKEERIDDALSAILLLNTVANTLGATLAGAQAAMVFGSRWMGLFSFFMTFMVLVLSEIIPKTLGAVYASRLVGFVAYTTQGLIRMLRYPLILTRLLTRLLARKQAAPISRRELTVMVAMAARDGTLPVADSEMVSSVLRYHEIKVEDVMTPRTVVAMLPASASIDDLLADEWSRAFSRIPIYEGTPDHVVGYVLRSEVLSAVVGGTPRSTPLERFGRPPLYLLEGLTVGRALRRMTLGREPMALVHDEYGGTSGLVTIEDLVETTLGIEIVDELDRVEDLRAEAGKLREKRLQQLHRWRQALDAADRARPAA